MGSYKIKLYDMLHRYSRYLSPAVSVHGFVCKKLDGSFVVWFYWLYMIYMIDCQSVFIWHFSGPSVMFQCLTSCPAWEALYSLMRLLWKSRLDTYFKPSRAGSCCCCWNASWYFSCLNRAFTSTFLFSLTHVMIKSHVRVNVRLY